MFAGLLAPAGLYAQKAYKDASNRVILELTEAAGMPAASVTSTGKTWTGSPSAEKGPMANNDPSGTINATVYQKLEIAPHDLASSSGFSSAGASITWVNAFNWCKSANHNGTGWRLPTQRELMLIHIFKPALESIFTDSAINGTAFSTIASYADSYWSATESSGFGRQSWLLGFGYGITQAYTKSTGCRARCVREVK